LIVKTIDAGLRTRLKVLIDLLLWLEPGVLAGLNMPYPPGFGPAVDMHYRTLYQPGHRFLASEIMLSVREIPLPAIRVMG